MPAEAGVAVRPLLITVPLSVHEREAIEPFDTVPGVAVKVVEPAAPLLGLIVGCAAKAGAGVTAAAATVTLRMVDVAVPPVPVAVS